MSYKTRKLGDGPKNVTRTEIKTKPQSQMAGRPGKWWKGETQESRAKMACDTAAFLKDQQQFRYRQANLFARMYGNLPLSGMPADPIGSPTPMSRSGEGQRPTMNIIQSIVDTKVTRIIQSKPRPVFLTDNGDYRERNLSKKLNNFIVGELYRTRAYELGEQLLRDAEVLGTGAMKILRGVDNKVQLERVLVTELLVDPNDAFYGKPTQLYQVKLVDRDALLEMFPGKASMLGSADQAYPSDSPEHSKTVADQVMVVEAWHLRSGPEASDGAHIMACTNGMLCEEDFDQDTFPFRFVHDTTRMTGFWGQGAAERLLGTQVEINKMLITSSRSINLSGVPRVWLEDGSKVVKAHISNEVGMIGTYRGTLPHFEPGSTGLTADFYQRLNDLIESGFRQEGVSLMAASSTKPAGLNSGAALREYDDQQSDRLASLGKAWDRLFVDLAYAIVDEAKAIAQDNGGKYTTVFVDKRAGAREVALPDLKLLDDKYVIQVFDASSLPRDPAGRNQKIIEYMQAGVLSMPEGRRLLDFPDIEQVEKLASSGEERILKILDEIVEDGKYTPPDPFMDPQLAGQLCTQYYNLYSAANLEEDKAQMLRTFAEQSQALLEAAQPPPMPMAPGTPGGPTQAVPEAQPTSPMMPQAG
jgi:hypothetical protein